MNFRGIILPSTVFVLSLLGGCSGGSESFSDTGDTGEDSGLPTDGGAQALSIRGRVILAPNGVSQEIEGVSITIGLFSKVDTTGLVPASEPISLTNLKDDGSFSLNAPADCSSMLIAYTKGSGDQNGLPQPGSIIGAYGANPVCKSDQKAVIYLDHYLPGANKPVELTRWKRAAALESIDALLQNPYIDYAAYRDGGKIEVLSARGSIEISRNAGGDFAVKVTGGANPFENDSSTYLSTYDQELAAGSNPSGTQYGGYEPGDPRLSFIEPKSTSYPFYAERLWQVFEDQRCGDVVTFPVPYGCGYTGNIGEHGSLDVTQSRATMIFSGRGVKKGLRLDKAVRAVDIAPTVAKIMGLAKTAGISSSGRLEAGRYLKWQDGEPLDEVIDGKAADYAVIFILDGLNFTELKRALDGGSPEVPAIKELVANGTFYESGQISNYPPITLPGHVSIGTGAYSGHHGVANNDFYERQEGTVYNIVTAGAAPSRFLRPWVETLFEAVQRTFGTWEERRQKGAFCASVNDPATRGAQYASLEGEIFDYSKETFDETLPETPGYQTYSGADNAAVRQCIYLYERNKLPIPSMTMINLAINDFVGHGTGPHSDMVRQSLADTDFRIARIIQAVKNAGIFDKTLIVLTSDHGQETQDRKRSLEFSIIDRTFFLPLLDAKGIKYIGAPPFLYLKTVEIIVEPANLLPGQTYDIKVKIVDEDTKKALSDADIQLHDMSDGNLVGKCLSDVSGQCLIKNVLFEGSLSISAKHPDYNISMIEFPVSQ